MEIVELYLRSIFNCDDKDNTIHSIIDKILDCQKFTAKQK